MFFKVKFDKSMEQVKQDLEHKDIYLLDVRSLEEFQEGHLPGAHLISVDQLVSRHQEIPRNQPIYIYCHSGQRARSAKEKLVKLGFHEVYNVGGISQWPYEIEV